MAAVSCLLVNVLRLSIKESNADESQERYQNLGALVFLEKMMEMKLHKLAKSLGLIM